MVSKSSILCNLSVISRLFNKTSNPKEALLYSKLAILELCGWIEESMDDVVKKYGKRKLKVGNNLNFLEKNIIKDVHSFDYNNNFRKMLMQVIGLINLETIEKRLDQNKLQLMKTELNILKGQRDPAAHTHIKGVAITIDAPSVTKNRVRPIYDGLKIFELELGRL